MNGKLTLEMVLNASGAGVSSLFETNAENVAFFDVDHPDVFLGLFNAGFEGLFDNGLNSVPLTGDLSATVLASIPEPEVVVLLGLSAGAPLVAGRRRR